VEIYKGIHKKKLRTKPAPKKDIEMTRIARSKLKDAVIDLQKVAADMNNVLLESIKTSKDELDLIGDCEDDDL
jgi:hypothetical protein